MTSPRWKYEITTGKLLYPYTGKVLWQGYAGGNCGKNPEAKNNPDFIKVAKTGPLCPGIYTFGTPVAQSHLGPFAIPLTPDPNNEMYGRGDVFCPGDTTPSGNAREGCIIMPRWVRDQMWASKIHTLEVVISL